MTFMSRMNHPELACRKTPVSVFFPLKGKLRNLLRGRGDIYNKKLSSTKLNSINSKFYDNGGSQIFR
jgi:hypothetical protein